MIAPTPRPTRHSRRGVAATEFALLLPIVCICFVITVDYARIFYYTMAVTDCARQGAMYGSQNPTNANDTTNIQAVAKRDAGDLDSTLINVSSTTDSATNPTYVTVTATYPFRTITNFPGITSYTMLSRSVTIPVTPWTVNP